jgi:hypothetical protein
MRSAAQESMMFLDRSWGIRGCVGNNFFVICAEPQQESLSDNTINLADGDYMTWIPDSGATIHATSRRELFSNYTAGDFGVVKMGKREIISPSEFSVFHV